MAILHWIKHPRQGLARLRYWLWERLNREKPWMCPGTIAFCEQHLKKTMTAIEFGSGRSTVWFAERVRTLLSVEYHAEWYQQVQAQLRAKSCDNVDYRLIALSHPTTEPEREQYDPIPAYVAVLDSLPDQSLGFAVVDGHYRTLCVRQLIPKMAPGGLLLLDDAQRWPTLESLPVPRSWTIVDDSSNGVKRCVIWQAPRTADEHRSKTLSE